MAGKVQNIKLCSPLKLHSDLTGKCRAICHYSYNLPLCFTPEQSNRTNCTFGFLPTQKPTLKTKRAISCQRSQRLKIENEYRKIH